MERCYVLFWESNQLKKVCVGSEPIDQPVPDAELVPLSRVIHALESKHLPLIVRGASPSLLSVMGSNRSDGRRFVVYHEFNEETFIQFLRQAHQDIFGMVDIITIVEFLIQRLRNAVYEEWTEDKVVLCRCLRRGSVEFYEYRELLTDLISLWPSIPPYIRCTVNPEARGKSATVSIFIGCLSFASRVVCSDSRVDCVFVLFQMLATDWHLIADNMIVQRLGLLRFVLDTCKYDADWCCSRLILVSIQYNCVVCYRLIAFGVRL